MEQVFKTKMCPGEQLVMTVLLVCLADAAMLGQPHGSALSCPALLPGGLGLKGCQSS
jgi:hypothetical protein